MGEEYSNRPDAILEPNDWRVQYIGRFLKEGAVPIREKTSENGKVDYVVGISYKCEPDGWLDERRYSTLLHVLCSSNPESMYEILGLFVEHHTTYIDSDMNDHTRKSESLNLQCNPGDIEKARAFLDQNTISVDLNMASQLCLHAVRSFSDVELDEFGEGVRCRKDRWVAVDVAECLALAHCFPEVLFRRGLLRAP